MKNKTKIEVADGRFISGLSDAKRKANKLRAQIAIDITKERHRRGIDQKEFAKVLGVSQSMVSKWESGEYNFTLESLCELYSKLEIPVNLYDNIKPKETADEYKAYSERSGWKTKITHISTLYGTAMEA